MPRFGRVVGLSMAKMHTRLQSRCNRKQNCLLGHRFSLIRDRVCSRTWLVEAGMLNDKCFISLVVTPSILGFKAFAADVV